MSFTKRIGSNALPGTNISSLYGIPITSTGCESFDAVLGQLGGLSMGSMTVIEETGTTDFSAALLRYFAAEGVLQGHHLHVCCIGEQWARELPDAVTAKDSARVQQTDERMKIAWRYNSLREHGSGTAGGRGSSTSTLDASRNKFCHSFDLTKRLAVPSSTPLSNYSLANGTNPFTEIVQGLRQTIAASSPSMVHRIVVPNLLSPNIYPFECAKPELFFYFILSLVQLKSTYHNRVVIFVSFSVDLFSRDMSLTKQLELVADNVVELSPLPNISRSDTSSPQGLFHIHCLAIVPERCTQLTAKYTSDFAFKVSRKQFNIEPWSLPPLEEGKGREGGSSVNLTTDSKTTRDIDF